MEGRKSLLSAKQNVVENIRKEHGSNFSWAFGEEMVKFNKRNTTEQASFPWGRAVDGLYIDYDRGKLIAGMLTAKALTGI